MTFPVYPDEAGTKSPFGGGRGRITWIGKTSITYTSSVFLTGYFHAPLSELWFMNHFYNKKLRPFARENRKNMTLGEILLWNNVLKKSALGVTFKRQRPMGAYILDFYAGQIRLAIEVDGYGHRFDAVIQGDLLKSDWLEKNGIVLYRIPDQEIFQDLFNLKIRLYHKVTALLAEIEDPPPAPSKGGME